MSQAIKINTNETGDIEQKMLQQFAAFVQEHGTDVAKWKEDNLIRLMTAFRTEAVFNLAQAVLLAAAQKNEGCNDDILEIVENRTGAQTCGS